MTPYSQQTWSDNDPAFPASAARFAHMEAGIAAAQASADSITIPLSPGPPATGGDDKAILQAFLNALPAGSGALLTQPYKLASPVTVPTNCEIRGMGPGATITATGNNYLFTLGSHQHITGLKLAASSAQSAGGAFDFSALGSNVTLDHLTIGNNLFYTFDLRPVNSGRGIVWIDRVRFDAVTGHNTPFKIGDGTHLITDIFISRIVGTASTNPDVVQWFNILNNVDTFYVETCDFFQGTAAMNLGQGGASGTVSASKWNAVSFDSISTTGVYISKCRGLEWTDCTISTIGGTGPGLTVAPGSVGFAAKGGLVQNCQGDGININAASQYTDLIGVQVSDNNQGAPPFGAGIAVSAGGTEFNISGCRSGNFLLGGANQQRGIWVVTGASDHYMLVNNRTPGNSISGLIDAGSGVNKTVSGNV